MHAIIANHFRDEKNKMEQRIKQKHQAKIASFKSDAEKRMEKLLSEVSSWPANAYTDWSFTVEKKIKKAFEPFHPLMSYRIDSVWIVEATKNNNRECHFLCTLNKQTNNSTKEYQTYQTEAVYTKINNNNSYQTDENEDIDFDKSFVSVKRIPNIWDSISSCKDTVSVLEKQIDMFKKEFKQIYKSYSNESILHKSPGDNPSNIINYLQELIFIQRQYIKYVELFKISNAKSGTIKEMALVEKDIAQAYKSISATWNLNSISNIGEAVKKVEGVIAFQNHCVGFIDDRVMITKKHSEISMNSGKEYSDVEKAFASFHKTYNFVLSTDTNDNHTRLNNFLNIEDNCLRFIELRKTFSANTGKILAFSKTARNIVKSYSQYVKKLDVTWNQDSNRSQKMEGLILQQEKLLVILNRTDVKDIDLKVKKLKDKSFDNVQKELNPFLE